MELDATPDDSSIKNDLKVFALEDSKKENTAHEGADDLFSAEVFKLSTGNRSKASSDNIVLAQGFVTAPGQNEIDASIKESLAELRTETSEMSRAGKGNTWDYGNKLYSVATLEIMTGDIKSGMQNMKTSIDILKKANDSPEDKEAVQRGVTEMMNNYAELLVQERPRQTKDGVLRQRREAEGVYAEVIKRAMNEVREPYEIADLYRNRGNNLVYLAANSNNVHTADGKAAYRQQMQIAIDTLSHGLSLVENQRGVEYIAPQALLYGSLGLAEMSRADKAGDKDAVNAEDHLASATDKWHEYKKNISRTVPDVTERAQTLKAANSMLAENLESYLKLLGSEGRQNTYEAQEALREYKAITGK